ncbi:alpha-N-arabinofuranosidase [Ruminococcus sp. Marseille-P6503]|uniref:alpha-N-arabinofuranosidase n=1 Tax=Ruminococcus sp. Marseille-P6503 TaxID=2364796 RepID=UPI000F51C2AA|nr:alpha-N-arabinofuranosidase [Ruminococcus sp. Marseille-P6503]
MKSTKLKIDRNQKLSKISRNIYGHFAEHLGRCIYGGIYVGEDSDIPNVNGMRKDVVQALREIKIPVLRWPGGCFADEYHWKDGIGKKSQRKKMINTHWGGVVEDNSFGTHEFFELCRQLDCEPYIAGNLGSGTVQEMSEWVEYMTFGGVSPMAELRKRNGQEEPWKLKYFGIGNESWGCGGNMRPEYYADEYRRYQTYCRNYGDNRLYKVACGPNADDYGWTDKLLEILKPWHTDAISLHYYTIPTGDWGVKGKATEFTDEEYYRTILHTLRMDELITKHGEIMDKRDPEGKIKLIVDEWGCWFDVEEGTNPGFLYQQNTMRDAIVAACNLNIFNNHSDRVTMANIAQAVNVLQSPILTDGADMIKTPTFYVFKMFCPHHDAELVKAQMDIPEARCNGINLPALTYSVSESKDGSLFATVSNCSLDEDIQLEVNAEITSAQIITAEKASVFNDFGKPENVALKDYSGFSVSNGGSVITLPKCSVVSFDLK